MFIFELLKYKQIFTTLDSPKESEDIELCNLQVSWIKPTITFESDSI